MKESPHTLFVWDFDWTIVNCNSDEYIPAQFMDADTLLAGFRELWDESHDWHACVQAMVRRAMKESLVTSESILEAARQMPYLIGVKQALDVIHEHAEVEQIILSDGNTSFIGAFLEANGMSEHFKTVVSNEGKWVEDDIEGSGTGQSFHLEVVHQSRQYGGHDCDRCPANLCKSQALRKTLEQMYAQEAGSDLNRLRIVYVGDGENDSCPALHVLGKNDVLLARRGERRKFPNVRRGPENDDQVAREEKGGLFGIMPALQQATDHVPTCRVSEWHTGNELRVLVQDLLGDIV